MYFGKDCVERGGGRASKMSSEAKSVTGAIIQKRNLGLREMKLNFLSPTASIRQSQAYK